MKSHIALFALVAAIWGGCSSPASPNQRIVGTWECIAMTKSVQQTYSKDGAWHMVVAPGGPSGAGVWSIEGDKLTIAVSSGEPTNITAKIMRLDRSVLIYEATNNRGALIITTCERVK
jgi:hypothetical protein